MRVNEHTTDGRRDRRGLVVWKCDHCGRPWFGDRPGSCACRQPPVAGVVRTLDDLACRHRRSIDRVEVDAGCCDGSTTIVDVGHCALYGRCTTVGQVDGTRACIDCADRS